MPGARVVATKRQFEAVFDFSPIGKALVAVDGRLLRVNRTFCQIVESTADVLCGRRDLPADLDPATLAAAFDPAPATAAAARFADRGVAEARRILARLAPSS